METIIVEVTAEHLNKGIPGDCWECPIALAILSKFPDAFRICVSKFEATFRNGGTNYALIFNKDIMKLIEDIDTGKPAQPFNLEFELRGNNSLNGYEEYYLR